MAAVTGATWSADNFLKNVYIRTIQTQYVRDLVLMQNIRKGSDKVVPIQTGGAKAIWSIRTGRNGNGTASGVEDAYPSATAQSGAQPESNLKRFSKTISITTALMDMARTDKQAFVNRYTDEMDNSIEDFKEDINRQMWLDGTGVIGVVGAIASNTSAAPTVTLDSTATHRWNPIVRPFMAHTTPRVQVYTTGAALQGTGYVSSVSLANGTIEITWDAGTPTLNVGDYIYYELAKGKEMTGLESIVGTGDIYGITAASYPIFQAGLVRSTFEDPTETALERLRSTGAQNGAKYKFGVTTWGVQAQYGTLLTNLKRFVNTVELKGGFDSQESPEDSFTGPMYQGVGPLIADNWCPQGVNPNTGWLVLPDTRYLFLQQTGEPKWDDADGKILKFVPGYGKYNAYWYWYAELCADRRNTMVIHKNMNSLV
jgi:hypothetical protein